MGRNSRVIRALESGLATIATLSFCCFFFGIFLAVMLRFFLSLPIVWSEELAGLAAVWMVFCGASVAVLDREHIRIDVVPRLPLFLGRLRRAYDIVVTLMMLLFAVALLVSGTKVTSGNWERMLPALQWPYAVMYLAVAVGGASMTVFLLVQLVDDLRGIRPPDPQDEPWAEE